MQHPPPSPALPLQDCEHKVADICMHISNITSAHANLALCHMRSRDVGSMPAPCDSADRSAM
jgi:hypothetical protein